MSGDTFFLRRNMPLCPSIFGGNFFFGLEISAAVLDSEYPHCCPKLNYVKAYNGLSKGYYKVLMVPEAGLEPARF